MVYSLLRAARLLLVIGCSLTLMWSGSIGVADANDALFDDSRRLIASTFFGGDDKDGILETPVAMDSEGNIFIAGRTRSSDIIPPGTVGFDTVYGDIMYGAGASDIVVAKFTHDLSELLAATYIGGAGHEGTWPGVAMTIDDAGVVYVAGRTSSETGFPMTTPTYQDNISGGYDMFVVKVSNDLDELLAATFVGGSGNEYFPQITIDNAGDIVLTGASSGYFPVSSGAYDTIFAGGNSQSPYPADVFVAKLTPDLTALLGATYLGGNMDEYCEGIAIDDDNNIYLTGWTSSSNYPTTDGVIDRSFGGGYYDAFVSVLTPDLTDLAASTFYGGSGWDFGYGIALDAAGNVLFSGHTASSNYLTSPDAFDRDYSTGSATDEGMITILSSDLTTMVASTYFGGSGWDFVGNLLIDEAGHIVFAGYTNSDDVPMFRPAINSEFSGGAIRTSGDIILGIFDGNLSNLLASTYLGGGMYECTSDMLFADDGSIVISGATNSSDFPTTAGAYDPVMNGIGSPWSSDGDEYGGDMFVTRFTFSEFSRVTVGDHVTDTGRSISASWADYDDDGYPDILSTQDGVDHIQLTTLYHNDGDGSFSRITDQILTMEGGGARGSSWADYDNNGTIDAFIAQVWADQPNALYTNEGGGVFSAVTSGPVVTDLAMCAHPALVDMDNDGDVDIIVSTHAGSGAEGPLIYDNQDGLFVRVDELSIGLPRINFEAQNWADADGDGDLDMVIAVYESNNRFYINDGYGEFSYFENAICEDTVETFAWGDYDNDGDLDLCGGARSDRGLIIYRNDGGLTYTRIQVDSDDSISNMGRHPGWVDYDNDGDLDLFVARGGFAEEPNRLYINDGLGNFTVVTQGAIVENTDGAMGVAWADYDRDGDMDAYFANPIGANCFYRNRGNDNNWISIACVGVYSNRSAIGARVYLYAVIDGLPVLQMREISSQSGYYSQNEMRAHFGLCDATVVDSIRIEWPSSVINTYTGVNVNQCIAYSEFLCGDANGDMAVNVGDAVYIINYVFKGGPAPFLPANGDANCDGQTDVGDAVYLINFVFKGGPPPCASCL